jgi:hypothetical protein
MRSLSRDLFGAVSREEMEMDFIERIFRVAPDNGTGTLEFLIVAALLILLFAVFARWREVRKKNHPSLSKAIATPRTPTLR